MMDDFYFLKMKGQIFLAVCSPAFHSKSSLRCGLSIVIGFNYNVSAPYNR